LASLPLQCFIYVQPSWRLRNQTKQYADKLIAEF
jgi:hypothetical protein